MKGYYPTLTNQSTELASKLQASFIELGAMQVVHEEDCKCEECLLNEND